MSENLKTLPNELTKNKVREMYNNVPSADFEKIFKKFTEQFNNNGLISRSKFCRSIYFNEIVQIVNIYGIPKGYKLTEDFQNALQQLKMEKEQKNYKHISHNIEKCVNEIRLQFIEIQRTLKQEDLIKEKHLIIQKVSFSYNLEASFIERIIGYKKEENENESKEI